MKKLLMISCFLLLGALVFFHMGEKECSASGDPIDRPRNSHVLPGNNKTDVIRPNVKFNATSSMNPEKAKFNSGYCDTVVSNWFLGFHDKITANLDRCCKVPIPGSAIVLVSLLAGFFALGKRKKRISV